MEVRDISGLGEEKGAVQDPLIRYAVGAGWEYLTPEEALSLRDGDATLPVLRRVFLPKVQSLNPDTVTPEKAVELANRLRFIVPGIEGNLEAWQSLTGHRTVYVESQKREFNVRFIDFSLPSANVFQVTGEFRFTGGARSVRCDAVFFINGLPVFVVETKAAHRLDGIAEALDQIRRYHEDARELFTLLQVFGLTHLVRYFYGATWNTASRFLYDWKAESAATGFEALVKSFFRPERVLEVLHDCILFTRRDNDLQKFILRPHQMRAVARALDRAADPAKKRGLIWHTQGSGKTYTMITIARRLIEDPAFRNPTVLMLVDRNELESQLFASLASVGLGTVKVAASKRHLRELLESDTRGVIVSMIHKFDDIPAAINTRENIFVLVDEAHRTTGGDLGNYLMGALPNATFFGFTGTPVDRTAYGQGTFKVFGTDDPQGYLDKYSIAESIADGTTVPLYYALAPNDLLADRETLEREFLNLTAAEGLSDIEELDRVLDRAVNLRNMLKSPQRVDRVAEFVARHFRENVEPMGWKAFLVGVDREACCLLKEALDRYLPPDYSTVVISHGPADRPLLVKYHLTDEQEKTVRRNFIRADTLPKILIVTEKLLTGFDAPVLYCLYLDKPMRDHVLLQAIARVNRPYEDESGRHKPGGFVLDFIGIFANLEKALAFDSRDVSGVVEGLDILKKRFTDLMERARKNYLPVASGLTGDRQVEAVLNFFMDEKARADFYACFDELEDLYEIISPDPFLRPFIDDYQTLGSICAVLRATFDIRIVDRDFARKTAELVRQHTYVREVLPPTAVYGMTETALEKIAAADLPPTVKIFNLARAIREKVAQEAAIQPYLISIGERAEAIIEGFKERQLTTEAALKLQKELIEESNRAEKERLARGLSGVPFAVFWLLRQEGVPAEAAEAAARAVGDAMNEVPYASRSAGQARQLRRELYHALGGLTLKDPAATVERIMRLIREEG